MQRETPRRLAAILAADIAGYSRLMGADEKGTHYRVQQILHECVEPAIAEHRGRLVKTTGDGFLAMFDSQVEAVRCAIVIQQSIVGRNLELPKQQWIQFRIGVNLGDVIVEQQDIYGEGVNIAARLQQIAEPGGVYISGGIYEQVKYKLVCGYQSLGDRKVKNITDPVPIYRVLPDPAAVERARSRQGWQRRALFATVLLLGAAGGAWYLWRLQAREVATTAPLPTVSQSAALLTPPVTVPAPAPPIQAEPKPPPPPPARPFQGEPKPAPPRAEPPVQAGTEPRTPPTREAAPIQTAPEQASPREDARSASTPATPAQTATDQATPLINPKPASGAPAPQKSEEQTALLSTPAVTPPPPSLPP
ncbi:MAG: hypothetical protein JOZ58_06835, partial [Acetobacteraceae bacterium]|nr:hypothetical protein [Acetobacteraceae bacterium]